MLISQYRSGLLCTRFLGHNREGRTSSSIGLCGSSHAAFALRYRWSNANSHHHGHGTSSDWFDVSVLCLSFLYYDTAHSRSCVWVAVYASSVGPLAYVYLAETSTILLRGKTVSMGLFLQNCGSLVTSYCTPLMLSSPAFGVSSTSE